MQTHLTKHSYLYMLQTHIKLLIPRTTFFKNKQRITTTITFILQTFQADVSAVFCGVLGVR